MKSKNTQANKKSEDDRIIPRGGPLDTPENNNQKAETKNTTGRQERTPSLEKKTKSRR